MTLRKVGESQTTIDINNGQSTQTYNQSDDSEYDIAVSAPDMTVETVIPFRMKCNSDATNNGETAITQNQHYYQNDAFTGPWSDNPPSEVRFRVSETDISGINMFIRADGTDGGLITLSDYNSTPDTGWFDPTNVFSSEDIKVIFIQNSSSQNPNVTMEKMVRKTVSPTIAVDSITKS